MADPDADAFLQLLLLCSKGSVLTFLTARLFSVALLISKSSSAQTFPLRGENQNLEVSKR